MSEYGDELDKAAQEILDVATRHVKKAGLPSEPPVEGNEMKEAIPAFSSQPQQNDGQQKEMPTNQQQKSYTVSDISKLTGIQACYIHSLKRKALHGAPLPEGKTSKRVLKTLQDLGIDWCDIVRDLPGWTKARLNNTSTCQISQTDNSEVAERNMGENEAVLPSESAELPASEKEPESSMETMLESDVTHGIERSVLNNLYVPEEAETLKQELRETDNLYPLGLGHLPLELLVSEIVRRFPRAEIVLR